MMTRKDFEAIAEVLDANRAPLETVLDMADMLGEQNPRFNRGLFIQASTHKLQGYLEYQDRAISSETN